MAISKMQAYNFFKKHGYNHPEVCREEEVKVEAMLTDMKVKGLLVGESDIEEKVEEKVEEKKEEVKEEKAVA